MRSRVAVIAVATLVSSGCAVAGGTVAPPPPTTRTIPAEAMPERVVLLEVHAEANRIRQREGLVKLELNEDMVRASNEFAQELALREELSHTSVNPARKDPATRLNVVGVKWIRVGENLAQLSPRSGLAKTIVQMWLDSPGHRTNLLNAKYTTTGVGVARDIRGDWYVVQMYATLGGG